MQNILQKYQSAVPRYTSYPTAVQFQPQTDDSLLKHELSLIDTSKPLSLYIHIPFCQSLCWYCGCNTHITTKEEPILSYLEALHKEIDMYKEIIGKPVKISHLHFGGGTPTYIPVEAFEKLMDKIYSFATPTEQAELAIEIDPRTLKQEMVTALAKKGINRVSLGIQDFDPKVQEAIHRIQPYDLNKKVLDWLKDAGITNVNFDLIYGLPAQDLNSIRTTIEQTVKLNPSRIALFGYAHVPWMMPHQKVLEQHYMPNTEERFAMAELAKELLLKAGYKAVGFDHFAKEEDSLYQSLTSGNLHRNFQGYTTDKAKVMLSLGASSIGRTEQAFTQNTTSTKAYKEALNNNKLPVAKFLSLSTEDIRRSELIEELLCTFKVDLNNYQDIKNIFTNPEVITQMQADNLCQLTNNQLYITELGKPFVRIAATAFDAYFKPQANRHAKAV